MDKQYFYLSGLPRSGSTVLASLLSQNPEIYCSPTSVLVGLLNYAEQVWRESDQVKSYEVNRQYNNVMIGIIEGLYKHVDKPVIIDKNRAWPNPLNIKLLTRIFNEEPKIICTVRNVVDVLASFIKLIRKNPESVSFIDRELIKHNKDINDENRCNWLMSNEGHVFQSWSVVRWGFDSGFKNFMFVEYEDLLFSPDSVLCRIYDFLEMDYFNHNFLNIENKVQENDEVYHLPGMHNVRKLLSKDPTNSLDILGVDLYNKYKGGSFWNK
jgi:sulfotransferase